MSSYRVFQQILDGLLSNFTMLRKYFFFSKVTNEQFLVVQVLCNLQNKLQFLLRKTFFMSSVLLSKTCLNTLKSLLFFAPALIMTLDEEAKRCFQWRWALICSSFVPTSMNLNWNGRPILYASTRATLMSCTTICQMWVLWNTYIMNSSLYCSVSFVSIADPRFVIQYLSIGKHWAPRCLFVIQWHLCYGSFEKNLPKPKFHKSFF